MNQRTIVENTLKKCIKSGAYEEIEEEGALRVGLTIRHNSGAYEGTVKHVLEGPNGAAALIAWENGKVSVDDFNPDHVIGKDGRLGPVPPKEEKKEEKTTKKTTTKKKNK